MYVYIYIYTYIVCYLNSHYHNYYIIPSYMMTITDQPTEPRHPAAGRADQRAPDSRWKRSRVATGLPGREIRGLHSVAKIRTLAHMTQPKPTPVV